MNRSYPLIRPVRIIKACHSSKHVQRRRLRFACLLRSVAKFQPRAPFQHKWNKIKLSTCLFLFPISTKKNLFSNCFFTKYCLPVRFLLFRLSKFCKKKEVNYRKNRKNIKEYPVNKFNTEIKLIEKKKKNKIRTLPFPVFCLTNEHRPTQFNPLNARTELKNKKKIILVFGLINVGR